MEEEWTEIEKRKEETTELHEGSATKVESFRLKAKTLKEKLEEEKRRYDVQEAAKAALEAEITGVTALLKGSEQTLEEALTAGREKDTLYKKEMVKRREETDRLTQLLEGSETKVASLEQRFE